MYKYKTTPATETMRERSILRFIMATTADELNREINSLARIGLKPKKIYARDGRHFAMLTNY